MTEHEASGVLRAIRAQARREERERIREELLLAQIGASIHPRSTKAGRLYFGITEALQRIAEEPVREGMEDLPGVEFIGTTGITDAGEFIDVGVYLELEDGEPDPYPVRLIAQDVNGTVASLYLPNDAADALIDALHAARTKSTAFAAAHAPKEDDSWPS